MLATFFNRYVGGKSGPMMRLANLNPLFSSTDGVHWAQATPVQGLGFNSVATVARGFVAVGASQRGERQALLRSTNGRSWSELSALPAPHGDEAELLAANHNDIVLERIPSYTQRNAPARFLSSTNGRSWVTGKVVGGALTSRQLEGPMQQQLVAVPGGFIAFGNTNRYIWRSVNGRLWRRVSVAGGPPASFQLWAASVDGDSLMVVEMPRHTTDGVPAGATTVWQLKLP